MKFQVGNEGRVYFYQQISMYNAFTIFHVSILVSMLQGRCSNIFPGNLIIYFISLHQFKRQTILLDRFVYLIGFEIIKIKVSPEPCRASLYWQPKGGLNSNVTYLLNSVAVSEIGKQVGKQVDKVFMYNLSSFFPFLKLLHIYLKMQLFVK